MQLFENLKVLELSSVLAGPSVGMFFAEIGANVLKIENKRTGGDITRSWKLPREDKHSPISAYFSSVNWGKIHVLLDLKDEDDHSKALSHAREADIILINFKAGKAKELKLDYPSLKSENPGLIYAQLTGFGEDDPRPAFDAVLQAESGFMSMNGTRESGPLKMPVALIDLLAAHQLKEAVLIALLHKMKSGKGAFIDVSLYKAALASLANQASNWLMASHLPQRTGSLHPNIAPYGEVFITRDELPVMLAVGTDQQFRKLCQVLNLPGLCDDVNYSNNSARVKNRETLFRKLKPAFKALNRAPLMELFRKHSIPAGAVKNMKEVFEDPRAQKMILQELVEGLTTKRVSSKAFSITFEDGKTAT